MQRENRSTLGIARRTVMNSTCNENEDVILGISACKLNLYPPQKIYAVKRCIQELQVPVTHCKNSVVEKDLKK